MTNRLQHLRAAGSRSASLPHCRVISARGAGFGAVRLAVMTRASVHLLPLDSILWISAREGRLCIHAPSGELSTEGALSALVDELGPDFQQISRNVVVNMAAVRLMSRRSRRGEGSVILHDGRELPVTRLFASKLREWLAGESSHNRPTPAVGNGRHEAHGP
jgi:DNA-binding LytR/AlgR family response regulator